MFYTALSLRLALICLSTEIYRFLIMVFVFINRQIITIMMIQVCMFVWFMKRKEAIIYRFGGGGGGNFPF